MIYEGKSKNKFTFLFYEKSQNNEENKFLFYDRAILWQAGIEYKCALLSWTKDKVGAVVQYECAFRLFSTEHNNELMKVNGPCVMLRQMTHQRCQQFGKGHDYTPDKVA